MGLLRRIMPSPFALTQCKSIDNDGFAALTKDAYIMEPKIDGWRMQIDVTPDGCTAWTRTNHDATGKMPAVERKLQSLAGRVNKSFRLDGEAVVMEPRDMQYGDDDKPNYNLTSRFLGSGVETCVEKQRETGLDVCFFAFDVLMEDDQDLREMPLWNRKEVLEMIGYFTDQQIVNTVVGEEPSYDQHVQNLEDFEEGSVLKLRTSAYEGRRHKSWLKLKDVQSADVLIIGYKPGQGKYEGAIGAIQFRDLTTGVEGYCSGMDDATREEISRNKEKFIHTTMEIAHFGLLVDGYRHPQFVRFRLDK
jgi:ATP-dependent DNA ligase